jgi:hypothetical protein
MAIILESLYPSGTGVIPGLSWAVIFGLKTNVKVVLFVSQIGRRRLSVRFVNAIQLSNPLAIFVPFVPLARKRKGSRKLNDHPANVE